MNGDVEIKNENEGADPTGDIKKQNPGEQTTADQGADADDPDKVQKLAKAGEPEVDPNAGQE